MGDHRLSVEIVVVGQNGKDHKISWWVNWYENKPKELFDAMVEMAQNAGLPVDGFYDGDYERISDEEIDYIIDILKSRRTNQP